MILADQGSKISKALKKLDTKLQSQEENKFHEKKFEVAFTECYKEVVKEFGHSCHINIPATVANIPNTMKCFKCGQVLKTSATVATTARPLPHLATLSSSRGILSTIVILERLLIIMVNLGDVLKLLLLMVYSIGQYLDKQSLLRGRHCLLYSHMTNTCRIYMCLSTCAARQYCGPLNNSCFS